MLSKFISIDSIFDVISVPDSFIVAPKHINDSEFNNLGAIVIESVFEYPHIIEVETNDKSFDIDSINDDDEFLLPEDMIGSIKKLILETWNVNVIRDTAEIPSVNLA